MGMGKGKKCDGTLIECACEKCSLLSSFLQRNTQGERNQLMGNLTPLVENVEKILQDREP